MIKELKKETMKIRLKSYSHYRHYGGRSITEKCNSVNAELVKTQEGSQPYICRLLESGAGYNEGHLIAVNAKDFDIK